LRERDCNEERNRIVQMQHNEYIAIYIRGAEQHCVGAASTYIHVYLCIYCIYTYIPIPIRRVRVRVCATPTALYHVSKGTKEN
jgi:hypothetical protein